jgi:hypothetical protein
MAGEAYCLIVALLDDLQEAHLEATGSEHGHLYAAVRRGGRGVAGACGVERQQQQQHVQQSRPSVATRAAASTVTWKSMLIGGLFQVFLSSMRADNSTSALKEYLQGVLFV